MYGLIKREIKMAGYRQSSFLRVYSLVNIPGRNLARTNWIKKGFILRGFIFSAYTG